METKKLTAKDLMIGDYVYSTFSNNPCKVQAIELSEHEYCSVRVSGVEGVKDIVSLSPIRLTAEILMRNGFVKGILGIFCLPNTDLAVEVTAYGKMYLRYSACQLCEIKSVNHLQHLMRDFGIDKEIEL